MPSTSTSITSTDAAFQPFSWLDNNSHTPAEHLAETSKDLGAGIATILQLIEASELESHDHTPLLNPLRRGELMRMAITSAQLLSDLATRDIARRNKQPV